MLIYFINFRKINNNISQYNYDFQIYYFKFKDLNFK